MASLAEVGCTYEGVCAILERKGKPRPSSWKPSERKAFLGYLHTDDGAMAYGSRGPGLSAEEEGDLFAGRQPGEDEEDDR
jgi:hypothetical protein